MDRTAESEDRRRSPRRRAPVLTGLAVAAAALSFPAPPIATPAAGQSWLWDIPRGLEPGLRSPGYAPDEVLVQFQASAQADQIERAVREESGDLIETVTTDGLVRVRVPAGTDVLGAIQRFERHPEVEYAAPNLHARGFFVPNDSTIGTYDLAWNLRAVDAYSAWDVVRGDPNVVLAILDTGMAYEDREIPDYELPNVKPGVTIYRQSPDLPGPFLPGWDFVNNDPNPNDDHGHGTSVATIAAGDADNVAGSAGIAFGVTLMPVKVLDFKADAREDDIIQGIRFAADQGADIINLSLGFAPVRLLRLIGIRESDLAHFFKPVRDAIDYAQRRGSIIVAASGNFHAPEVSIPAEYPGVIAVGATGVGDGLASYSSYGHALDFVAPGGDFTENNNDDVQDGVAVLSIKPFRCSREDCPPIGSLANPDSFNVFIFFGTSGASPHVAGAVALLMSAGLREQGAIEQTLRATASPSPVAIRGGFDPRYGSGLINVGRAVRNLVGGPSLAAALPGETLHARLLSPNPARGQVALSYQTTKPGTVRARVFDVRGALVRIVREVHERPGHHRLLWDGRDQGGAPASSGIYFLRVDSPEGAVSRKVAFLR